MDAGAEFVSAIADLEAHKADTLAIEKLGVTFVQHRGKVVDASELVYRPMPTEISFATLAGLLDYVKAHQVDGANHPLLGLNVMSPTYVVAMTDLDDKAQRAYVANALYEPAALFGKALTQEQAIIALLTTCENTPSRAALVSMISRIVAEEAFESEDDGVSTKVTARKGIANKGEIKVEPFHELKVRLTFPEVVQPTRTALLRLTKQSQTFYVTLHEADGAGWKLQTVADIKGFLTLGLETRGVTLPVFA